jgi:multidrug efflux pump subunit AcrA (membrane-fusion protein)
MRVFYALILGLSFVFVTEALAKDRPPPVVVASKVSETQKADEILLPARTTSKVQAAILAPVEGVVVAVQRNIGERITAGGVVLKIKNTDPVYEFVAVPVTSGVGGVVSALDVSIGSKVARNQEIGRVTDPNKLSLTAEIPATEAAKFRTGIPGEFFWGAAKAGLPVVVSAISPLVDPATGTVTMELKPTENTAAIPLGVIGKIKFSLDPRPAIEIPQEAVVYRGKKTYVRTLKGNKAKIVPVEIADTKRGLTEVTSGLNVGEAFIVRASGFVDDGQTVVVQEEEVAKK